jgi:hypothetical protein
MTAVLGLITDNDVTAYREVRDLAGWCQDNKPFINMGKGAYFGLQETESRTHLIHIDRVVVELAKSFKFLVVHIAKDLSWSKQSRN